MIRTILVPTSGSSTDLSVFATALAAARPLAAHLDFYHVCLTCGAAAPHEPHLDFAIGRALSDIPPSTATQVETLRLTVWTV